LLMHWWTRVLGNRVIDDMAGHPEWRSRKTRHAELEKDEFTRLETSLQLTFYFIIYLCFLKGLDFKGQQITKNCHDTDGINVVAGTYVEDSSFISDFYGQDFDKFYSIRSRLRTRLAWTITTS